MTPIKNTTNFDKLILIALMAVLLMSIVPILIRSINVNPATIGIVRLAIGALGMAIFAFVSKNKLAVTRKELLWLIVLGVIFALHWYTYFVSIKIASASLAAIEVATFGIHLLLLSSLINKQKLTTPDIFAVLLSLTGIYLTSSNIDIAQTKLYGFYSPL
jgi:drug/metabolite transporter (DMT)-like permease